MRILNNISAPYHSFNDKEVNNDPSLAVPNQSLTVQEILRRSQAGTLDYASLSGGYYDDSEDFDIDTPMDEIIDRADCTEILSSKPIYENKQQTINFIESNDPPVEKVEEV